VVLYVTINNKIEIASLDPLKPAPYCRGVQVDSVKCYHSPKWSLQNLPALFGAMVARPSVPRRY